ncbi:uncharacterized protein PV09_02616 [Verruconis gallopava]|uniref:Enoyl reductase (ER) domain-containing protein n=1 Tax=Verruconis gallopava TaxID=253628 RepID=A0A0D1Z204_9PEZI|nr:uncharacterized protein PV09_02616 [Verruconis gallopava]KIW06957.1 hypothetical protein PV09_02616 [Verruconis gallopava]
MDIKNEAAWLVAEKARPLQVRPAPPPPPNLAANEVVIKVAFAAVNPTDYKMQDAPYFRVEYPFILGTDVAGTVVRLGSDVTRFRIGQRVIGHCDSLLTHKPARAGYQLYTVCRERLVCAVPDDLPLANAAVLPLGVDTAAAALFQNLALPLPLPLTPGPQPTGRTVLVWGGSSSVGGCAVQLAVAAGMRVVTACGASNFEYVRSLGASEAFDHRSPDVVEQIAKVLKHGDCVVDCIGSAETQRACGKLLGDIGGGTLPIVLWPQATFPSNVQPVLVNGLAPGFTEDELKGAWGTGAPEIGQAVWHDFMPTALETGKFLAKPDPVILRGGLSKVQDGIDMLRKGVSAQKVVIEIAGEP